MTERLTIHRDWTADLVETKYFTLEFLLSLMNSMGMLPEDFSEIMTGLNCDSYADLSCDIMSDFAADNPGLSVEEVVDSCWADEEFQTCYTVYRIWNNGLEEEQAKAYWKRDNIATLEGILEDR